ncbi:hypothetical protein SAMN06265360_1294 [Haloechinothrix alba]|uniref:Uncharacterized protein n=1 Tax=Haloechinothrix alba TaxID=664784 RepID=A0A239A195_9PSEU|nr:hypothetical protein SAMN06265360_1294 [Haloechinothrix alba]
MMLECLGQQAPARRLNAAITAVYREGRILTRDQGGNASTIEFTQAVLERRHSGC